MSSKTLSSKVKIKTSELPLEVGRHYGVFDDIEGLDVSGLSAARRGDQRFKNDITNALTGFRQDYVLGRRNPEDDLIFETQPIKVNRPQRPYSYIEPRRFLDVSPDRTVKIKEVRFREPVHQRSAGTAWHYIEPLKYSSHQRTLPSYHRPLVEPEENRVLADYKDALDLPVYPQRHHRWSVYGSVPSSRSRSTPPEFYRPLPARVPIGDRLTRRKNHEYSIGVKLAESQSDLDTFNRLLDKKFGGGDNLRRSVYYPSWAFSAYSTPWHYNYRVPTTDYVTTAYSPPTRVAKPTERPLTYRYADYGPFSRNTSSYYYSSYIPPSYDYSRGGYWHEPWYLPYSKGSYYTSNYYGRPLGGFTTRYYLY